MTNPWSTPKVPERSAWGANAESILAADRHWDLNHGGSREKRKPPCLYRQKDRTCGLTRPDTYAILMIDLIKLGGRFPEGFIAGLPVV